MSETFTSPEWYRIAQARLSLRRDVRLFRHIYLGRPWYVLSDPTSGKVHRLTPAAHEFAGRLDGTRSVDAIWQDLVGEFGADAPAQSDIVRLLSQLHGADLLSGPDAPLLEDSLERRDKDKRQLWKKMVLNPLSATVPLVDPNRFLGWLSGAMSILPSGVWWLLLAAIIAPALLLVPLNWQALSDRGFEGLLDLENLALIACIYPIVKAVHELGHGVVTRSRGGAVHEMGLMFIAFYPIPYVEASASLAFPGKWSRAAVAAAGVAVELAIAACAFYVWLYAEPGTVRAIAYNTMLISGFSTLAINGNPLLKFDGYHVFSDLIEIPNLGKRGNEWWGEFLRTRLLGTRERNLVPHLLWERFWFVIYPPAAFIYRIFISLTIALFVASTYWLVGVILAVWSLVLSLIWPTVKVVKKALTDARIRAAGPRAFWPAAATASALIILLFVVPVPHRGLTEGVVWLPPEALLRAGGTGFIDKVGARHGEPVAAGQPLLALHADERETAVRQAEARLERAGSALNATLFSDRPAAVVWESERRNALAALDHAKERLGEMVVSSSVQGRFEVRGEQDLLGRFVREGDVIAHILPQADRVVRAIVRQENADLFRNHLRGIEVRFAHDLNAIYRAKVVREVPGGSVALPSPVLAIEGGGSLAATKGDSGQLQSTQRVFQFDLAMVGGPESPPPFGMRAIVRLDFDPMPIAGQIALRARQLFLSVFDV